MFTCDQYMYERFALFLVIKAVVVFYQQNESHTYACYLYVYMRC